MTCFFSTADTATLFLACCAAEEEEFDSRFFLTEFHKSHVICSGNVM